MPKIDVSFEIDENSILTVKAKDQGSGKKGSITIANDGERLNRDEIDQMIKESERYAEQDKKIREKLEVRAKFANYISSMKSTLDSQLGKKLSIDDQYKI